MSMKIIYGSSFCCWQILFVCFSAEKGFALFKKKKGAARMSMKIIYDSSFFDFSIFYLIVPLPESFFAFKEGIPAMEK